MDKKEKSPSFTGQGNNKRYNHYSKDNSHQTQLQTIFRFLQNHVATASMVSAATFVSHKCLTRYKRDLEQKNMLWEVEKNPCEKTGYKAWWLTCDPEKAPKKNPQYKLWGA